MERRPLWRPAAAFAVTLSVAAGCGTMPPTEAPAWSGPTSTPAVTSTAGPAPSRAGTPTPSPTRSPTASPRPSTPKAARYAFPVRAANASFGKTHSGYPASDIFADCGSPVVAVADGVVLEVSRVDTFDPDNPVAADRGGLSVSVLGDDGVRYYGSHLSRVASGIRAGGRVTSGQRLGDVGRTGRANNVCHLHFGISPPCARTGDWWIRRGAVWPARFMTAWRSGKALSPASTVAAWRRANGCPSAP